MIDAFLNKSDMDYQMECFISLKHMLRHLMPPCHENFKPVKIEMGKAKKIKSFLICPNYNDKWILCNRSNTKVKEFKGSVVYSADDAVRINCFDSIYYISN